MIFVVSSAAVNMAELKVIFHVYIVQCLPTIWRRDAMNCHDVIVILSISSNCYAAYDYL